MWLELECNSSQIRFISSQKLNAKWLQDQSSSSWLAENYCDRESKPLNQPKPNRAMRWARTRHTVHDFTSSPTFKKKSEISKSILLTNQQISKKIKTNCKNLKTTCYVWDNLNFKPKIGKFLRFSGDCELPGFWKFYVLEMEILCFCQNTVKILINFNQNLTNI